MTEVTLSAMKDYDEYHTTEKPGSCGYPIPGVTAKVNLSSESDCVTTHFFHVSTT